MMTDGVIGILLAHLRAFGCIMFFFLILVKGPLKVLMKDCS